MKIRTLMVVLMAFVATAAFAQKKELKKAKEEYDKYEGLKQASGDLAMASLKNAKEAVDKAAADEKTSQEPLTFAVKGAVYAVMSTLDSVPATSMPLFTAAEAALKKAKEMDTKGENKDVIENGERYLAQYQLNKGVREYQSGDYDLAYTSFDYYRQVLPTDTNAIYYTGLSAANAAQKDPKFFAPAIKNYTDLLKTNFSKNDDLYYELSTLHLLNKDTASAMKVLNEGIAKYPTKSSLRSREIELQLITGKQDDAIAKIEAAIANDPTNKGLYYYAGITYAKIADVLEEQKKKDKSAAAQEELQKKKDANYAKSAEMYKKALEIDSTFADAALNLGYVMVNPAIDTYNAANKLPVNKQKEYEAAVAKANKLFDAAKPYLQKAIDLNPKSTEALANMKVYYLGKKDTANANKIQKQIEDLQANQ